MVGMTDSFGKTAKTQDGGNGRRLNETEVK